MTSQHKTSGSVYFIAFVAATGGFLFGYDLQVISGAILYLRDYFQLTTAQEAFAMASALLGCLVGPPVASLLADGPLGRRWSLMVAAALLMVSAIGTALPHSMVEFNIYRVIGGVGVGLASVISPMYIAEMSPAPIRGRLVSMNQLMVVVGAFLASLVTWQISSHLPAETGWRWMFATECIPILLLMLGLFFTPRSPRWLVQRGLDDEARGILTRIDGEQNAHTEMVMMKKQLHEEEGSWKELLRPGVRIALMIAIGLALFQQWTGVSLVTFYAPTIFEMAGLSKEDAIKQLVIANVFNIVCTSIAMILVDRLGRRKLYLAGVAGMALGMLVFGLAFHFHASGPVLLASYLLGFGAYLFSLAPLCWLIMSEVFPTRVRAKGMAVASFAVWLAAIIGVYALKLVLEGTERTFGSPGPAFWCFSVVCMAAWLVGYLLLPETKDKSLEEIGAHFLGGADSATDTTVESSPVPTK